MESDSMVLHKRHLYGIGMGIWTLLVAGIAATIYLGLAEPVVALADVPGEVVGLAVAAVAALIAGFIVYSSLQSRLWRAMGREAGLTPASGSLLPFGKPALTGTIGGRVVRVRLTSEKTGGQSEGGSNRATYTIVEADLDQPAETGVILGRSQPGTDLDSHAFGSTSVQAESVDDQFVTGPGSRQLATEVLTGPVRESLLGLTRFDQFLVGAAAQSVTDAMPDMSDSFLGSLAENKLESAITGDPSTVTHKIKGTLLDSVELQRQLIAVTKTADAFEDATAVDETQSP